MTTSIGTSVLTVHAVDADSIESYREVHTQTHTHTHTHTHSYCEVRLLLFVCVQVRYRIEDSLDGRFRVDEESGTIFTRGSFDNLDGQRLKLMVTKVFSTAVHCDINVLLGDGL